MHLIIVLVGLFGAVWCVDAAARPSEGGRWFPRSLADICIRILPMLLVLGATLALTGRLVPGAILTGTTMGLLVLGSNLKRGILGESLLFSDAAIIEACFRHPRFYVSAVALPARIILLTGIALTAAVIVALFLSDVMAQWSGQASGRLLVRLGGIALALAAWGGLRLFGQMGLARRLLPEADCDAGIRRYGLFATLALGWLRWRDDSARPLPVCRTLSAPASQGNAARNPPIVIVIQCESFADLRDLNLSGHSTPELQNLERAKSAGHVGRLHVSGFGAYTMRTEYGVLFGQEEVQLGFSRFDPYLSALRQGGLALPARFAPRYGTRVFVHPHDLRFYGRDRLMPAIGFTDLIGAEAFGSAEACGPHIGDRALGMQLVAMIDQAAREDRATFVFAVSIENHGPWKDGLEGYLEHLVHGDELLGMVSDALAVCGRPAILAFYGDHRPSIPGVVTPDGPKSTPFVLRGFGGAEEVLSMGEHDLTPAALHHAIFDAVDKSVR